MSKKNLTECRCHIIFLGKQVADFNNDIYAAVKYGSYLTQTRAQRNKPYTLACPLDNVNDTEIYIYSASQLASVGDLSGLKVGFADFSTAAY